MKLDVLTREQVELVRQWRNEERQFLRTPYRLSHEQQQRFFDNVVDNPESRHRYFAVIGEGGYHGEHEWVDFTLFLGMGGLTNIEWENSRAEISLIIDPKYRGEGYGKQAVKLLLTEGFDNMALQVIHGEVYKCANVAFWDRCVDAFGGLLVNIPWPVKRWGGEEYGSIVFAWEADTWSA